MQAQGGLDTALSHARKNVTSIMEAKTERIDAEHKPVANTIVTEADVLNWALKHLRNNLFSNNLFPNYSLASDKQAQICSGMGSIQLLHSGRTGMKIFSVTECFPAVF